MDPLLECSGQLTAVRKENHLTIQDGEVGSYSGVLMRSQANVHFAFLLTSPLAFIAASKVGIDFFVSTV
jgi:hypothetical protein